MSDKSPGFNRIDVFQSKSSIPRLKLKYTCKGCSSPILCLSAGISHKLGGANPVSSSFTPKYAARVIS